MAVKTKPFYKGNTHNVVFHFSFIFYKLEVIYVAVKCSRKYKNRNAENGIKSRPKNISIWRLHSST